MTKVIAQIESVLYVVNSERDGPRPIAGLGVAAGKVVRLYPAILSAFYHFNTDLRREAGLPLRVAARHRRLDWNQFLKGRNDAAGAKTAVK